MHAVIKIVSFLIFGAAVALGNQQMLLAATMLVVLLYLGGHGHLGHAMKLLRRLRWLLVSILLVYLFFTPGQLLLPALSWGPTLEGMVQGAVRIAALALLVFAVNWLLESTEQEAFLSATLWCLSPLALTGFPHERLAVRISLTLDAVRGTREAYLENSCEQDVGGTRMSIIVQRAQRLVNRVIEQADAAPLSEISVPQQSSPPILQWLIPVLLAVFFIMLRVYGEKLASLLV